MRVYRSNRVERLLEVLSSALEQPWGGPLDPEVVAVPSAGLGRWLTGELSRRLGVGAHLRTPRPLGLLHEVLDRVPGHAREAESWAPDTLRWTVLALLPQLLQDEIYSPLRAYLQGDPHLQGPGAWQLSARIARVLDTYTLLRPDLVQAWSEGGEGGWQAALLRALEQRLGPWHLVGRAQALQERLGQPGVDLGDLPPRLFLFGISTLPPLLLQCLAALAPHREIHLLVLSPARPGAPEHPLRASLDRLGLDLEAALASLPERAESPRELQVDPGTDTLLHALQTDMLHGRDLRPRPRTVRPGDRSLVVHSCHGPMRQVEVLHSELLRTFSEIPELEPREVLVLVPDVEAWAPLVEAVFDRPPTDPSFIPYAIADRSQASERPVSAALLRLLDLAGTRLTASAVLDLVDEPLVHRRFGLEEADLEALRGWVEQAGIRWGADAAHRHSLGLPATPEGTWRQGLDRLLLGWALPDEGQPLIAHTLPVGGLGTSEAQVLGRAAALLQRLLHHLDLLQGGPRKVEEWSALVRDLLEELLLRDEEHGWEHDHLRGLLAELESRATAAGLSSPLSLQALKEILRTRLSRGGTSGGFLSGGVCFAAMRPQRPVPFRVVCLLGLDDGVFPRVPRRLGFDLVAAHPLPGDRSPREDDRHLFLHCLISARDRLILCTTGQSIRDNEVRPPSVVLAELLDHLDEAAVVPEGPVRQRLVCAQPLQPFSPAHFGADRDGRRRSWSQDFLQGARALQGPRRLPPHLFPEPLPPMGSGPIELSEVLDFWEQPMRALVEGRLGCQLDGQGRALAEAEPLELQGADRARLGRLLLDALLQGQQPSLAVSRSTGLLPVGAPGELAFTRLRSQLLPFAERVRSERSEGPRPAVDLDLEVGPHRLRGRVSELWGPGLLRHRWAPFSASQLLRLWIEHLALQLHLGQAPLRSRLVVRTDRGGTAVVRLSPVQAPSAPLQVLLGLFRDGSHQPLLFFPETSLALARRSKPGDGSFRVNQARRAAREAWEGAWGGPPGEGTHPALQRVLGGADPTQSDFSWASGPPRRGRDLASLAWRVWGPVLEHSSGLPL